MIRTLVKRDGELCQICRLPIYFKAPFLATEDGWRQSHPCAPSVDHIVPISKGGRRGELSNLRLTHRLCNHSRSNRGAPSQKHVEKVARLLAEVGRNPLRLPWRQALAAIV